MRGPTLSTVFTATFLCIGCWCVFGVLGSLGFAQKLLQLPSSEWGSLFLFGPVLALGESVMLVVLAGVLIVAGAVAFGIGFGLLRFKNWARQGAILFALIGGCLSEGLVILLHFFGLRLGWQAIIPLGWGGLVIWYYLRPSTQTSFQQNALSSAAGVQTVEAVILAAVFCAAPFYMAHEQFRQEASLDRTINAGLPMTERQMLRISQQLKSQSPEERRMAAIRLGRIGPRARSAMNALTNSLNDSDLFVQREAALALGKMGSEARLAVPVLIATYKNGNRQLQSELLTALAQIKDESILPFLFDVLMQQASASAAQAMASFGDVALPWLIRALKEGDGRIRYAVCDVVQEMKPATQEVVPALVQIADGSDQRVTLKAIKTLNAILCLELLGDLEGRSWQIPAEWATRSRQSCSAAAQAAYLGPPMKRLVSKDGRIYQLEAIQTTDSSNAPTLSTN